MEMAVIAIVSWPRLCGRVEALKAICHMRLDRDDLRTAVEDAATGRRRRGADKDKESATAPATLDDFRCSPPHPSLLHWSKRPLSPALHTRSFPLAHPLPPACTPAPSHLHTRTFPPTHPLLSACYLLISSVFFLFCVVDMAGNGVQACAPRRGLSRSRVLVPRLLSHHRSFSVTSGCSEHGSWSFSLIVPCIPACLRIAPLPGNCDLNIK